MRARCLLVALLASAVSVAVPVCLAQEPRGPSLVGIDHIPMVVGDVDAAADAFRTHGFAIKPGRLHDNGLRNRHLKFTDGSGIELMQPPASPGDAPGHAYAQALRQGEGPVYLSLHARDTGALKAALDRAGIGYRSGAWLAPTDPALAFLFFVSDNRSPTDRPEHFAHANGARAMPEVRLALEPAERAAFARLMRAVGARASVEHSGGPRAEAYAVRNGRIVVVPVAKRASGARQVQAVVFGVPAANAPARTERAAPARADATILHGLRLRFEPMP